MKPIVFLRRRLAIGVALISLLSLPAKAASLEVGLAEIDITPHIGYRMAGYFNERLSTGVHDPLKAKAIILQNGDEKFAFAFCDLVGVTLHVTTNARAQFSKVSSIPVSHIVIAATHSHTGPSFDNVLRDHFHNNAVAEHGKDPQEQYDYPEFLTSKLVKVFSEANAKLEPAKLSVGIAKCEGLSFNRRYHMKDGRVVFNPGLLNPNIIKPAGPIDPDVGFLFVHSPDDARVFGGLTIFACHCDTVGGTEFSADYPFYLQQTLRGEFGEKFISAFAAGTCGDINHVNTGVKQERVNGFDVAERIGSTLAKTLSAAHRHADAITKPDFAVAAKTLAIPMQEVSPEQIADARGKLPLLNGNELPFMEKVEAVKALDLANYGKTWPMEVQVFRLDRETAMVGLPGEIFVDLGLAIKKASPFKRTFVISICNDRPSYVPTKKAFTEGSYEITNARVKPGAGEMLVEAAVELLNKLK